LCTSATHPRPLHPFPTRRSSDLVKGGVAPPVLAGRLPRAPNEIALGGRELRALHKRVGDRTISRGAHGPVPLVVVGQVVLSPERSEEHTSELQSRVDLVCRLLLE